MPITRPQVAAIENDISARLSRALANLESQKSWLGSLTSNNDTIEQSEGALRDIQNLQVQPWISRGNELADAEQTDPDNDDTKSLTAWQSAGQAFVTAIGEIDGYGSSASLNAVIGQTVQKTATDIGDGVKVGIKIVGPLAVILVLGIVVWKLS